MPLRNGNVWSKVMLATPLWNWDPVRLQWKTGLCRCRWLFIVCNLGRPFGWAWSSEAWKWHAVGRLAQLIAITDVWRCWCDSWRRWFGLWLTVTLIGTKLQCCVIARKGWASECLDVKNYKGRLNLVWHSMLYSYTCLTAVGIKE